MPVWNCQGTVTTAVASILAQTYSHWELLIMDDGSDDQTLTLVKQVRDNRIYVVTDKRRLGLPARLNQAIEQSRGTYFARMDADDIAYPERLQCQLDFMRQNPQIDLVGSGMIVFDNNGRIAGKIEVPVHHHQIILNPFARIPIAHPTFFGKKAWFQQHRYNEKFLKAQDQELLLRSYRSSKFGNISQPLLGYRHAKINLKKSFQSRLFLVQAQMHELRRQRKMFWAWQSIARQFVGAILDTTAVASGLHHKLLPQWSGAIVTPQEKQHWQEIWQDVSAFSPL
ncbi:MAG: glycosyltransferase [Chloroflexi bacterium]|nr:glycosyltransferase [Chloroflexota bacterium]